MDLGAFLSWLSASLSGDCCQEYVDACNEIMRIDQSSIVAKLKAEKDAP